ncbi:hypothetical protein HK097_006605, partial [Rhizophlyctis rosea]
GGAQPEILMRKASLRYDWDIVMRDARLPPGEAAGELGNLVNGRPGDLSLGRTSTDEGEHRNENRADGAGGAGVEGSTRRSGGVDSPVVPPKSGKRSSQSSRRGSQASQASSISTSIPTEPVPQAVSQGRFSASERGSADIERKSSEVVRANSRTPSAEPDVPGAPSGGAVGARQSGNLAGSDVKPDGSRLSAESEGGGEPSNPPVSQEPRPPSDANTSTTDVRSSRVDFDMMEEYLNEMLNGKPDTNKLTNLETAIRQSTLNRKSASATNVTTQNLNSTSPPPLPRSASVSRPPRIDIVNGNGTGYDDSGLNELLSTASRRRTMSPGLSRAPSRNGSNHVNGNVNGEYVPEIPNSPRSTLGRSRGTVNGRSDSLSQIFEDMQVDLEKSLTRTRGRGGDGTSG